MLAVRTKKNSTFSAIQAANNNLFFQPKLNVGKPGDKYEVEADKAADKVVQGFTSNKNDSFFTPSLNVQQKSEKEPEENFQEKPLLEGISTLVQTNADDSEVDESESNKADVQAKLENVQGQLDTSTEIQKKEDEPVESEKEISEVQTKNEEKSDTSGNEQLIQLLNEKNQKQEEEVSETEESISEVQPKSSEQSESTEPTKVETQFSTAEVQKAEEESLEVEEDEETVQEKSFLQKNEDPDDENTESIQAKSNENSTVDSGGESLLNSSKVSGTPLPDDAKSEMESGFGADFSDVRIHTGQESVQMNKSLGAQAFTHGNDIYFNEGKYNTHSNQGKHLLAHELTHTIQQGASVQPKLIQKADDTTSSDAVSSVTFYENKKKETSIDTSKKNITIPTLKVPAFKQKFGPTAAFTILPKVTPAITNEEDGTATDEMEGATRSNDQVSIWQKELQNKGAQKFKNDLDKKVDNEKAPKFVTNEGQRIYYFQLKKAKKGRDGIIFGDLSQIQQRLFRPFWDSGGKYLTYDVDHKVELQLGGANDINNMWLLESASNRSSGSKIKNEKVKNIRSILTEAKKAKVSNLPDEDKARKEYSLTISKGLSKGLGVSGGKKTWELEQIQKGKQLAGLDALKEQEVAKLGLRGSEDKLAIYSGTIGGIKNDIPWDEKASQAKKKVLTKPVYIGKTAAGATLIKEVHYDSGSNVDGVLICSVDFNKGKQKKYGLVKPLNNVAFSIKRTDAVQYGGYISKQSVAEALSNALEFKGLSPIQINQVGLDGNTGISAIGKIKPSISLIEKADIDIVLDEDGVRVRKVFDTGDFNLPSPFKILNSGLEISVGSNGLGIGGEVAFEINKVGTGMIKGKVDSSGNFAMSGSFDVESDLFNPASVKVAYENDVWSFEGKIGIQEGTVKGVRDAEVTISYLNKKFGINGTVNLDIPKVEDGKLTVSYSEEEGLIIKGDLSLGADVPGIQSATFSAKISKKGEEEFKVAGSGTVVPKIPGMKGNPKISLSYDDGAFLIEGEVPFEVGESKASGTLKVGITNQVIDENNQPTGEISEDWKLFGKGTASIELGKGIVAEGEVELRPDKQIIVSGKVALGKDTQKPSDKEKKWDKTLFEIGPPPIILFVIPPIGASLTLKIEGGAKVYASFTPPYFEELSLSLIGFNITNPAESQEEIIGKVFIATTAKAGFELYLKLTATLSVLVAKISGYLKGSIGLEANGKARAGIAAKWSRKNGLEITDGEISIEAMAQFLAKLSGGIRVYLDLWLAEIDIWEEEIDIASVKFGDSYKVGMTLPLSIKDGTPEIGDIDQKALTFPDLSSESEQQKIIKQGAMEDDSMKPPPPPSEAEATAKVKTLDSGSIFTTVLNMEADEIRGLSNWGLISRDTYVTWLKNKYKNMSWGQPTAAALAKDNSDFENLKSDLSKMSDNMFVSKEVMQEKAVSDFIDEHPLFIRKNGKSVVENLLKSEITTYDE